MYLVLIGKKKNKKISLALSIANFFYSKLIIWTSKQHLKLKFSVKNGYNSFISIPAKSSTTDFLINLCCMHNLTSFYSYRFTHTCVVYVWYISIEYFGRNKNLETNWRVQKSSNIWKKKSQKTCEEQTKARTHTCDCTKIRVKNYLFFTFPILLYYNLIKKIVESALFSTFTP